MNHPSPIVFQPAKSDLFQVAVASNNDAILRANLLASPALKEVAAEVHVERDAPSAAIAYNRALDATDAPYVVFAHHDVYLPRGWIALLQKRIAEVAARDPDWALIGAYGRRLDGGCGGPVWSTSLGFVIGQVALEPAPVQSFDELLIVVRRDAGLRFDEALPGFHLFGTDIVQTARAAHRGAYVVPLPLVHNDGFHAQLDQTFGAAYDYMRRKWRDRLPLMTPVTHIDRFGLSLWRSRLRNLRSRATRQAMAGPTQTSPAVWADRCGWSDLTP